MGFFSPTTHTDMNPYAMPAIQGLENFGRNIGLGQAGKSARGIIKGMNSGDYSGLAGTVLSPIHDRYTTNLREGLRSNQMGANAFMQGWQPQLMAAQEGVLRRQMAEGEGMAYGEAIPQLYGQATNTLQNAINSKNQTQLGAYEAALRGRIAGTQQSQEPSTWDKIMGVTRGIGQFASLI